MCAKRRHWPMNQRPKSANSPGQQGRVFVLRLHDDAISLKALEILGQRQRDSGTASRKRRIRHRVLPKLRDIRDARIFDAPNLFRIFARI